MRQQQDPRRWVVLAVALLGLTIGSAAQYGLAFLIPSLRADGLSLEEATLLVTAPIAGILTTLILWGAAADRWGERRILAIGLVGAGAACLGAAAVNATLPRWLFLFAVGALGVSVQAGSGRLILGSFAVTERGLAMGIRQTGQPLGVGAAALVLPSLAVNGVESAFAALGVACLATAALIWAVVWEAPKPAVEGPALASPYADRYVWRIHVASALLVVPQFAVAVFAFDYLVNGLDWSMTGAGALLAATQIAGAASRILAGAWSDRAGSRLRPMRLVAVTIGFATALLAALALAGVGLAVGALAFAAIITTTPNGLAFTAVAERAGARWAGRALGIHNTFQNGVATVIATPLALLISAAGGGATGYALAFATVVAFPFVAAILVPVRSEIAVQRA